MARRLSAKSEGQLGQRRQARERYRAARAALTLARREHRARLKGLRAEVRAARRDLVTRGRAARAELVERHRAERDALRAELRAAREMLRQLPHVERAAQRARVAELTERLEAAKRELAWVMADSKPGRTPRALRGLSADERRAHLEGEALHDIPEPEHELFRSLVHRRKIKQSPRRSLAEAYLEWAHDHPAQVSEYRHAPELAQLKQLEHEERAAWEDEQRAAMRKTRRRVTVPAAEAWEVF